MNPDTNKFEMLRTLEEEKAHGEEIDRKLEESMDGLAKAIDLVRPNGSLVPKHWSVFKIDEHVVIKNYTFKVAYIGETSILFEPVGPVVLDDGCTNGPGK